MSMGPLNTPLQPKENDYLKTMFGQSFVNTRAGALTHLLPTYPQSTSVYSHHCYGSGV